MQIFNKTTNYDFMGKHRMFLIISGAVVLVSIIATFIIGPKFGIDFLGGSEIQVKFQKGVEAAPLRASLKKMGFDSLEVVSFGSGKNEFLIRLQAISPISKKLEASSEKALKNALKNTKLSQFEFSPGGDKLTIHLSDDLPIKDVEKNITASGLTLGTHESKTIKDIKNDTAGKRCESVTCKWPYQDKWVYKTNLKGVADRVLDGLRSENFGKGAQKMRSEWVGPKVGKQLRSNGIWALVYALLFIMLYIAVRFDLRFAPGAVVALIHDILITIGIFSLARVEVTLSTVAALLAIVGYSLNDTIVVFDRIRENISKMKERKLLAVINISINQTLSRTVLTSMTTLLTVLVILFVGWNTSIRDFAFALLIGILVGTYSSIFIASPVVVWLDKRIAKRNA